MPVKNTNKKKKALIIEDDLFTREMYQMQFEKSGYNVVASSDGIQGLVSIFEEDPDFVLLDIILPKMDGVTLLSELRKKEKEQKTIPRAVIMLTNLGRESIMQRCMDLGATGYIIKARFTPKEVVSRVEELLAEKEKKEK